MRPNRVRRLTCAVLLLLLFCSRGGEDVSGVVDETDTGVGCVIRGAVVFRDTTPVVGADVNLYDQSSLRLFVLQKTLEPVLIRDGYRVTGGDGVFQFDSVDTGRFTVAIDYRDSLGALVPVSIDTEDTLVRADAQLGLKGSVDGQLDTALFAGLDSVGLFLPEINQAVPVDSLGFFTVPGIPAWDYVVYLMVGDSLVSSALDTVRIPVLEGDTTVVRNLGGETGTVIIKGTIQEQP